MPESVGKKSFIPGRSYELELKIKDLDYTADLISCQILSSLNSIYDVIKLELFIDARDILTGITGEDPLKLMITLIGDVYGTREENLELELMYVKSEFEMPIKSMLYKPFQVDRTSFPIFCVTRKPFKTMNKLVNGIYIGKTIQSIIQDLVSSTGTGATLDMDTDDLNNDELDQVLIPPMTLSKAIKYLNNTFGIYKGIFHLTCDYNNTVKIKNLTKRMNKEATFIIYQLASDDSKNMEYLTESTQKPNVYYTYDSIHLSNDGNKKVAFLSKNIKFIVKPSDTLFYEIDQDLETLAEDYGLSYSTENNKKIKIDSNINERTKYYTEHTGYEKEDTFAIAQISKSIANLSNINFRIERNMNLLPLINVGQSVKFNSKISEYVNLTGKYILSSVIIDFNRTRDWEATSRAFLIRTNKER